MIDLNTYASKFDSISLIELESVALYKRMDTKYVLTIGQLSNLMDILQANHKILEINQTRIFHYRTDYFDTYDFQFYTDHHNGYIDRIKVRQREYVNSGLKFYEIKRKTSRDQTEKSRIVIDAMYDEISPELYQMISYKRLRNRPLEKKISNDFNRMTLTSHDLTERITIDTDISFVSKGKTISIPNVVILELKQQRFDVLNPLVQTLKKMRIYPSSFSKYTIGVALLKLHRKRNQFKPQLLKINHYDNNSL